MNQVNRNKVEEYLVSENVDSIEPLVFLDYKSPVNEFDPSKFTVDDMVVRALLLSKSHHSAFENGEIESYKNRYRSCLDIWRHIKYYYPDISIFDVMHSLYSTYHIKTSGQFCCDVNRRTFKIELGTPPRTNYMSRDGMHIYCNRSFDEFGLDWEDWKDI
jgi:hypothetical protein